MHILRKHMDNVYSILVLKQPFLYMWCIGVSQLQYKIHSKIMYSNTKKSVNGVNFRERNQSFLLLLFTISLSYYYYYYYYEYALHIIHILICMFFNTYLIVISILVVFICSRKSSSSFFRKRIKNSLNNPQNFPTVIIYFVNKTHTRRPLYKL